MIGSGCEALKPLPLLLTTEVKEPKVDQALLKRKKAPVCLDAGAKEYSVPELEANGQCWKEHANYLERKFDALKTDIEKREELKKSAN